MQNPDMLSGITHVTGRVTCSSKSGFEVLMSTLRRKKAANATQSKACKGFDLKT